MLTVGGVFDGTGLLAYGLHLAGLHHAWLCEREADRRYVLGLRWPGVPILDDVRDVGAVRCERVDVIAGGFPCKGASTAGKLEGFGHPETVLWREMARAVGELRPRYVLVENVANLLALHDGAVWGEVLGDLAALGYDTTWDCIPAAAVGATHRRDRVFAVACHTDSMAGASVESRERRPGAVARPGTVERALRSDGDAGVAPHPEQWDGTARLSRGTSGQRQSVGPGIGAADRGVAVEWGDYEPAIRRWEAVHGPAPEPLVRRVDDRSTARVERSRLSALGDGVQVQVAYIVGRHLMNLDAEARNAA